MATDTPPTHLRLVPDEPDAGTVEVLRDLLGMAERGELVSIAFAAECRGRETLRAHSLGEGHSIAVLVCALEREKLALLRRGED